jgi:hypothetical protein
MKAEEAMLKPEAMLLAVIEKQMDTLCTNWMKMVRNDAATRTYGALDEARVRERICRVYTLLTQWLKGEFTKGDFASYYVNEGAVRRREGFRLSEVIQAFVVARRVLWYVVRDSGMLGGGMTVDMALDLNNRVMHFFDQSMYYMTAGYEKQ